MASIRLTLYFKKELKTVIDYGLIEFGKTTVKRFHKEYKDIKHRLMQTSSFFTQRAIA